MRHVGRLSPSLLCAVRRVEGDATIYLKQIFDVEVRTPRVAGEERPSVRVCELERLQTEVAA